MTTMTETGFGELLRHYRIAAGLTQEELAERAGVSIRGISDLERGARRTPHLTTASMLADALALSPPTGRPSSRPHDALPPHHSVMALLHRLRSRFR